MYVIKVLLDKFFAGGYFTLTNIFLVIALVVLILCSAFFSASEIAFSSSSGVRLKTLAEENVKGSRKALYISEHFDNALSAVLVGNNFVNILSTTLCAYLFLNVISNPVVYNVVNTVVMTIVILIFGEIIPKSLAKNNPEKACLLLAPILYVVMKILFIFCFPFNMLQKALRKNKNTESKKPTVTEDELETIVETMEEEGVIEEQDADIIYGALKFSDVSVKDVMTPRVDVVCINIKSSIEDIKKVFLKTQFSRIPVYEKSKDNIIGILNQKTFFSAIVGKNHINIHNMLTPALFVSKTTKVNDVMKLMQKEQNHIAIVSDEYGGTSGIITMEDCFEEVFGEVYDEHDDIVTTISKIEENKYRVNAELSVEELFDFLQIEKMPKEKYSNIASFLCHLEEDVPQQGKVIAYKTIDEMIDEDSKFIKKELVLSFKLARVEKRRIREVELTVSQQILDE